MGNFCCCRRNDEKSSQSYDGSPLLTLRSKAPIIINPILDSDLNSDDHKLNEDIRNNRKGEDVMENTDAQQKIAPMATIEDIKTNERLNDANCHCLTVDKNDDRKRNEDMKNNQDGADVKANTNAQQNVAPIDAISDIKADEGKNDADGPSLDVDKNDDHKLNTDIHNNENGVDVQENAQQNVAPTATADDKTTEGPHEQTVMLGK